MPALSNVEHHDFCSFAPFTIWLADVTSVKSIPPNTENSLQYGYDENDNNMSNETKRETNYSTTKWNDVKTHNYMQLTKYNKYTNDDIYTNACVVHMIH